MSKEVEWIPSPNYSSRPVDTKVDTIVIHYTASMNINGTISWFKNPESKVSAHYIIGRGGRIVQMVKHKDKAWHAGKSSWKGRTNVNKFSIGIELVGTKDSGFTEEQYDSTACICALIQNEYNHAFEYVGHSDIAPGRKVDPGEHWDWNKFNLSLNRYLNPEEKELDVTEDKDEEETHIEPGKDVPETWMEKLMFQLFRMFIHKFY